MIPQPQLPIRIVAIIAKIPLYKLLQPGVQVGDGPILELRRRGRDVRVREWDVAVARHLEDVALGLHVQILLQDVDECRYCHRGGVAQVEDAQHR